MPLQTSHVQVLGEGQRGKRRMRYPEHRWNVKHEAFEICPFLIAPVLPGETLRQALFQCRAVTDPLKSSLVGWWMEHYFFYVKITDLEDANVANDTTLRELFLDPQKSMASHAESTTNPLYYQADADIIWTEYCHRAVVNHWFRNEGEIYSDFTGTNYPMAKIKHESFMHSVTNEDTMEAAANDPDLTDVGSAGGAAVTPSEIEDAMRLWQYERMTNLTDITYEDFLKSYGVRGKDAEPERRPELLRMSVEWQYPSNTIFASSLNSAVSWAIRDRIDKDRYFSEPGFIYGVTIARPKVYLGKQVGSGANMLDSAWTWLPAILTNDADVGWKEYTTGNGPLDTLTDGYYVDVRDLFIHGDQFTNKALTDDESSIIDLPEVGGNLIYPTAAMARSLFVDDTTSEFEINQDGVCSLHIATRQMDTSPRSNLG